MRAISRVRKVVISVSVGLVTGTLSFGPAGAERIGMMLDWVPSGVHSGFYSGLKRGVFKAEGIDLNLIRGSGSANTVQRTGSKEVEYGYCGTSYTVVGRSRGVPVKIISMAIGGNLIAIYTLEKSGIRRPKDLEGRKIGDSPGGGIVLFPAFAKMHGIKKWEFVRMTPSAKNPSLLAGKIDFILTLTTVYPALQRQGKKVGVKVKEMLWSDYGIDVYSYNIIARDDRLEQDPVQARRMVRAILKSLAWGIKNPDAAVADFLQVYPDKDPKLTRAEWAIAMRNIATPDARKHGLGWIGEKKMAETVNLYQTYMDLPRRIDPKEVYTRAFLPREKIFP
ncbi:MAG: ABC transporter substrate-binding protein [Nitrospinota bacterium]